ncbi:hypothetical protein BU26DRAFT_559471 [Trematosphaeria pertusa]|uniref:Uncharacterized protein n=1 Tax=Trematosphaeria pertusa TaxID=390896 RepID=A0A6A6IWS6_9PLEO|nr:uncharacterized protein BU26DRAFT_559471 [Trematosphaeria pertusa]KAF2254816.1 hypothetical protein BU26DRAFT_559471 [Trematosphaeria pertusa]
MLVNLLCEQSLMRIWLKYILLDLIHAVPGFPSLRSLPSKRGTAIYSDNIDPARNKPLLDAVLNSEPVKSSGIGPTTRPTNTMAVQYEQYRKLDRTPQICRQYTEGGRGSSWLLRSLGKIAGLEPVAQAVFERCTAGIVRSTGRRAAGGVREGDALSRFARLVGLDVHEDGLQFGSQNRLNLFYASMNTQYFIAV